VKEGDPLYRIDQRPFEVEVQANQAALTKAEATYERAVQQARRPESLRGNSPMSYRNFHWQS